MKRLDSEAANTRLPEGLQAIWFARPFRLVEAL
jgi:hypothetical protein